MLCRVLSIILVFVLSVTLSVAQNQTEPLFTLEYPDSLSSVLLSPDENLILAWGRHHGARLWDAHTGEVIADIFKSSDEDLLSVAWSPDSAFIITGTLRDVARIWNTDGEFIHELPHDGPVLDISWYSKDVIYTRAWFRNPEDNANYRYQEVYVWNADGDLILRHTYDEILEGVDWRTETTHLQSITANIDLEGDGQSVLNFVWVFTLDEALIDTYAAHSYLVGTSWQPRARYLPVFYDVQHYRNGTLYSAVYIFDREGQVISILEHGETVAGAAWNTDQSLLLTWEDGGVVRIWRPDGTLVHTLAFDNYNVEASWSPDDRFFMVKDGSLLYLYTSHDALIYRVFPHNDTTYGAVWNRDGTRILSWSNSLDCETRCSYEARLWSTNRELIAVFPHDEWIPNAIWFHDDTRIITWSDGIIKVWDTTVFEEE